MHNILLNDPDLVAWVCLQHYFTKMSEQILILGHSFISRLKIFASKRPHHSVDLNMGLNPNNEKVLMEGFPGGNLQTMKTRGMKVVHRFNPQIVVLQIGSNDLCNHTNTVQDVARGIIELAITLKFSHGIKKVCILQVLHKVPPKKRTRHQVDITWFNERCDELNRFLGNYFKDNKVENISFWKHQGFWLPSNKRLVYTDDGTHLNESHGYPKYYQSIRGLVVSLLKK